jgi:hypothetical protein
MCEVLRVFNRNEAEERSNSSEPQVTRSCTDPVRCLKILQERGDEYAVEIRNCQTRGALAQLLLCELE